MTDDKYFSEGVREGTKIVEQRTEVEQSHEAKELNRRYEWARCEKRIRIDALYKFCLQRGFDKKGLVAYPLEDGVALSTYGPDSSILPTERLPTESVKLGSRNHFWLTLPAFSPSIRISVAEPVQEAEQYVVTGRHMLSKTLSRQELMIFLGEQYAIHNKPKGPRIRQHYVNDALFKAKWKTVYRPLVLKATLTVITLWIVWLIAK